MEAIKITSRLISGISVNDNYSPDLGSILEYFKLKSLNQLQVNPSANTCIIPDLPVAKHYIGDDWLWAISSPVYQYSMEQINKARKRWDADFNYPISWGKKKAKIQTDGGPFKSADRAVPERIVETVTWYAVGDVVQVKDLLKGCTSIGHRRAAGYGQVHEWLVEPVAEDWSLVRHGQLMTPLPQRLASLAPALDLSKVRIMHWNTKAPRWDKTQAELCFMPKGLVKAPSPPCQLPSALSS
jgi:CRISPR type IV-associated protein Csf3